MAAAEALDSLRVRPAFSDEPAAKRVCAAVVIDAEAPDGSEMPENVMEPASVANSADKVDAVASHQVPDERRGVVAHQIRRAERPVFVLRPPQPARTVVDLTDENNSGITGLPFPLHRGISACVHRSRSGDSRTLCSLL